MEAVRDPRLKLVLVDDHDGARKALVRRLDGHEHLVVAGDSSEPGETLELVQTSVPHIALVDPVRSDGLGNEIVFSLTNLPEFQRPLVFVHLAFFDTALWELARAAGADGVVLKRIDVDALAVQLMAGTRDLLPRERWPAVMG